MKVTTPLDTAHMLAMFVRALKTVKVIDRPPAKPRRHHRIKPQRRATPMEVYVEILQSYLSHCERQDVVHRLERAFGMK